jgi:hypothetical protein
MTSTTGTEAETPLSQGGGFAMWPDDMVCALDQQLSQVPSSALSTIKRDGRVDGPYKIVFVEGFSKNSVAPPFIAFTVVGMSPCPVRKMIGGPISIC